MKNISLLILLISSLLLVYCGSTNEGTPRYDTGEDFISNKGSVFVKLSTAAESVKILDVKISEEEKAILETELLYDGDEFLLEGIPVNPDKEYKLSIIAKDDESVLIYSGFRTFWLKTAGETVNVYVPLVKINDETTSVIINIDELLYGQLGIEADLYCIPSYINIDLEKIEEVVGLKSFIGTGRETGLGDGLQIENPTPPIEGSDVVTFPDDSDGDDSLISDDDDDDFLFQEIYLKEGDILGITVATDCTDSIVDISLVEGVGTIRSTGSTTAHYTAKGHHGQTARIRVTVSVKDREDRDLMDPVVEDLPQINIVE